MTAMTEFDYKFRAIALSLKNEKATLKDLLLLKWKYHGRNAFWTGEYPCFDFKLDGVTISVILDKKKGELLLAEIDDFFIKEHLWKRVLRAIFWE